jgi:hypothetical protein
VALHLSLEVLAGLLGEFGIGERECGEDAPQELVTNLISKYDHKIG